MYVRFVSPWRCIHARAEEGIFCATSGLSADPWLQDEIDRCLDWFREHLQVPDVLSRCRRNGVCWFRASASQHVTEARYLAWLVQEAGTPIEEVRARRPGTVIWADEHQIVALPRRDHPRRFRRFHPYPAG